MPLVSLILDTIASFLLIDIAMNSLKQSFIHFVKENQVDDADENIDEDHGKKKLIPISTSTKKLKSFEKTI